MLHCTRMQFFNASWWLTAELILLYVSIPVIIIFTEDIFPLIPTILVITGFIIVVLRLQGWHYRELLILGPRQSWTNMLVLFLVFVGVWTAVVLLWFPENFLEFPTTMPGLWLMVIVLYPLVSAFPQEILYRTYFFRRYPDFFENNKWLIIILSGTLFMWGHLLFMNPIALGATLAGGLIIAWRYYHTRSVLLASVEHALYGNLFFTLGLGQFLYSGMV